MRSPWMIRSTSPSPGPKNSIWCSTPPGTSWSSCAKKTTVAAAVTASNRTRKKNKSLVNLRPGECENRIHDARRRIVVSTPAGHAEEDLFMRRIQCESGYPVAGELFHRDLPARGSVAVVVEAPGADGFAAATIDAHARRWIDAEIARTRHLAARPPNDGFRWCIPAGRPVEDQKRVIKIDDQKIVERIDRYRWFVPDNLRARSFENAFGRDVAVRHPIEYEDGGQGIR